MSKVWVVTHDSGLYEEVKGILKRSLPGFQIQGLNMAYKFEREVGEGRRPQLIVTTGTCIERAKPDEDARTISYIEPANFGRQQRIRVMSVPYFFNWPIFWWLRLKIYWWKRSRRRQGIMA